MVKKLLKEQVDVKTYLIDTIKIYKDKPQLKVNGLLVEIYFANGEYTLEFPDKKEAKKFVGEALKEITGKNLFVRAVEKVKDTVAMVDETLGIDSVGITKVAVGKGVGLLTNKGKSVKKVVSKTGGLLGGKTKKVKTEELSPEEQAKALEHFKKLFDEGVITQEEFDKKKKQIIG